MGKTDNALGKNTFIIGGVVIFTSMLASGYWLIGLRNSSSPSISQKFLQHAPTKEASAGNEVVCDAHPDIGRSFRVQTSSSNTLLVRGPTEREKVKVITPGKVMGADSRFTYLWNKDAQPVPVIAPAHGTLVAIEYKTRSDVEKSQAQPDYDLVFAINCDTFYRINHVTDPIPAIRALIPEQVPADRTPGKHVNKRDNVPTQEFFIRAGEAIGMTTGTPAANNWDFAVFIREEATCPYELLPSTEKVQWLSLLGNSSGPVPHMPCEVSGKI